MANEQMITIRGRLTGDPELKFTPNGAALANFTIASNARVFDKQTNDWRDKEAIFWRCQAWKDMAENVAATLYRGAPVVALAELESRTFETKQGEKRTVTEARIEAIGPDLRWVTGQVGKPQQGGGNFGGQQAQQNGSWGQNPNQGQQDQVQQPVQSNPGWGSQGGNDEPPF